MITSVTSSRIRYAAVYRPSATVPRTRPIRKSSDRRLLNRASLSPRMFSPKRKSSTELDRDTARPGRHGQASHSMAVPTTALVSIWPTRLQTPNPANAIPTPTAPPESVAAIPRKAIFRKASSRRRRAIGTHERAAKRNTTESTRRTGVSSGWSNRAPSGPAATTMMRASPTPMALFTQKAVSRSLRVTSFRWISASPKPDSTSTDISTTKTDARATMPKASGSRRRARTTKTTAPASREETDFSNVHAKPRTAVLPRPPGAPEATPSAASAWPEPAGAERAPGREPRRARSHPRRWRRRGR
jgi:hypothetical protein